MNICCHCHGTLLPLQAYMYHINVISLGYKHMSQIMARTNREQMFVPRKNTLECESSRGTKVPGPFCSGEQKFQGANWPGSYWPIRSGSELARKRKGCESVHQYNIDICNPKILALSIYRRYPLWHHSLAHLHRDIGASHSPVQ